LRGVAALHDGREIENGEGDQGICLVMAIKDRGRRAEPRSRAIFGRVGARRDIGAARRLICYVDP
jgi:hypothetical protein